MSNVTNNHLAYGLNSRIASSSSSNLPDKIQRHQSDVKKKKLSSVLQDDSSSDDENDTNNPRNDTHRRDIAAQQRALRQRAAAALASATAQGEASVYDYDGSYDTFKGKQQHEAHEKAAAEEPKQSRYIEKLLTTAQKRQLQMESVREKKRAKELLQEEQENQELYRGKEQFVTESYKRKLQERQRWLQEQEDQDQQDKRDSETKMGGAGFYSSSIMKNVVMGHGNSAEGAAKGGASSNTIAPSVTEGFAASSSTGFTDGFAASSETDVDPDRHTGTSQLTALSSTRVSRSTDQSKPREMDALDKEEEQAKVLAAREQKLSAARERYFARMEAKKKHSVHSVR